VANLLAKHKGTKAQSSLDLLRKSIHPLICANRREFQMQLAKISENSRIKILWRKTNLTFARDHFESWRPRALVSGVEKTDDYRSLV
jgi:hypothetical protein